MRLDKYLSNLGYGSRNEIKKIIKDNRVSVNGILIKDSSYDVRTNDKVYLDEEEIYFNDDLTLMMNKPSGYICSNVDEKYPTLLNLVEDRFRRQNLSFAGRLDYDTLGLVILSNNGSLIHKIISPKSDIDKVYDVKLLNKIEKEDISKLLHEMPLLDKNGEYYLAKAKDVKVIADDEIELTISEGKFHQVKRMIEYIGNEVVVLKRIQIGSLSLGNLKEGEYLALNEDQIKKLLNE